MTRWADTAIDEGTGALRRRFARRLEFNLGILLMVALAVRLAVIFSLADLPWFQQPNADSALYDEMGRAFAAGDMLIGHEPLRLSPGYPFFVGAVYRLLGDGALTIRF